MNVLKHLFIGDYGSYTTENQYKIFFTTNLFLVLGILIHVLYVAIFTYYNMPRMVFIELSSILTLSLAVYINHKKIKYIPAIIMCVEIGLNGVMWAIFLQAGYSHYLYTFIALLAVYLFLELKDTYKVFITIFLLICANIAHSKEIHYESFLTDNRIKWLSFISLNMTFIIITIELTINDLTSSAYKKIHKETVEKMEDEIMRDSLTKLYNRRYFQSNEENFNKSAQKSECCVVMLDIDHFKKINDTYGHDTGDEILIFFADKMMSEFRTTDVLIRWGGEEFVVILNNTSLDNAVKRLNNFRKLIQKSVVPVEDEMIKFTFTAGVYVVKKGITVSDAIKKADKYLYDGKQNGRNSITYK